MQLGQKKLWVFLFFLLQVFSLRLASKVGHGRVAENARCQKIAHDALDRAANNDTATGRRRMTSLTQRSSSFSRRSLRQIGSSSSDFKTFLSYFENCAKQATSAGCSSVGFCVWDAENACLFVDIGKGQGGSVCLEAAPLLTQDIIADEVCYTATAEGKCEAQDRCYWGDGRCLVREFEIYFGFSDALFWEVLEVLVGVWTEAFLADFPPFLLTLPGYNWNAVRDWKLPRLACPLVYPKKVCDVAYGYVEEALPINFYCQTRSIVQEDFFPCTGICQYDEEGDFCTGNTLRMLDAAFFEMALSEAETSADKRILQQWTNCDGETSQEACDEPCLWSTLNEECFLPLEWIYSTIAEAGGDEDGVLCRYLSVTADSGCFDAGNSILCGTYPNCFWRSNDGICRPTAEYLQSTML